MPSILWIDDDAGLLAEYAARLKEDFGVDCDMAADLSVAVAKLLQKRYDLLITDLHVPLGSAAELEPQTIAYLEERGARPAALLDLARSGYFEDRGHPFPYNNILICSADISPVGNNASLSKSQLFRDPDGMLARIVERANPSGPAPQALDAKIAKLEQERLIHSMRVLEAEVLQGFRHTARTYLDYAITYARAIGRDYTYKGAPEDNPLVKLVESLEGVHHALMNIAGLRFSADKLEVADIGKVFDDACELLRIQFEREGIEIKKSVRGNLRLELNIDAVKSAFANLLLNSIEAFRDSHVRRDRRISFSAQRSGNDITIDYIDNGPGIRVGQGSIRRISDIWEPGKTSKKAGSGYGLPMARQVFQQLQSGSIDLRESKSGVLFRIRLRSERD